MREKKKNITFANRTREHVRDNNKNLNNIHYNSKFNFLKSTK